MKLLRGIVEEKELQMSEAISASCQAAGDWENAISLLLVTRMEDGRYISKKLNKAMDTLCQ